MNLKKFMGQIQSFMVSTVCFKAEKHQSHKNLNFYVLLKSWDIGGNIGQLLSSTSPPTHKKLCFTVCHSFHHTLLICPGSFTNQHNLPSLGNLSCVALGEEPLPPPFHELNQCPLFMRGPLAPISWHLVLLPFEAMALQEF